MIANLLDLLFGCSHSNTTVPIFDKERRVTYVVCLDCGCEFAYCWKRMQRGPKITRRPLAPDAVAEARRQHKHKIQAELREEIVKE